MGRAPCCEKVGLKRGRWTAEEDEILKKYIQANGEGSWRSLPKNAGLLRCGKSCRLRWINYLRSDLKRGNISSEEEEAIIKLHASLGNRWSLIAGHLPGRTDNEIKNYWNSHLSKKIQRTASETHLPLTSMENNNINNVTKRRGGRTSRFAMKRNKAYLATIAPKLLEQKKRDRQLINGIVSMPPIPSPGALSWQEEAIANIIISDECPTDQNPTAAPLMLCPNNDEELDEQMLYLKDIMGDGDEVNTNGSFFNLAEDIEGESNTTVMVSKEEREISGKCGWYSSASSSTNSLIEDRGNWNLDGVFDHEGNNNKDEGDKMLSWLWDVTASDTNGEEETDSDKQNAMVAWLLS